MYVKGRANFLSLGGSSPLQVNLISGCHRNHLNLNNAKRGKSGKNVKVSEWSAKIKEGRKLLRGTIN